MIQKITTVKKAKDSKRKSKKEEKFKDRLKEITKKAEFRKEKEKERKKEFFAKEGKKRSLGSNEGNSQAFGKKRRV